MTATIKCFGCGAAAPDTARFCGNCGRQIADPHVATLVDETASQENLLDRLRRILAGEFVVERELARGGMGIVFKAADEHLGRTVALKVLSPELGITARAAERFKREGRMVAELEHPNIVPVYRVGQLGGTLFIAMKFIEGRSLDEITAAQGALPIPAVLHVLRGAARSLTYAHERDIVHRDVKAANILLDRDGRVMVSDFGVALRASDVTLTVDGAVIGTPGYMSPEQCAGKRATPQSDQYSLGVVAFQMLTGALPFRAESLPGIMHHHFFTPLPSVRFARDDVPPDLLRIIERLMAKAPAERFPTTRELLEALEALPFGEAERNEGEGLLRRLTAGGMVTRVATREMPALPDAPTLHFERVPPRRRDRGRWGRRRWAALAAGLALASIGAWTVWPRARGDAMPPRDPVAGVVPAETVVAPPAAARPIATGRLRLLTSPGDAAILIDGRQRGLGSVLDLRVAVGRRRLEVRARGYVPFDTILTIAADSTVSLGRITLREPKAAP